jgi:hypothetical protein
MRQRRAHPRRLTKLASARKVEATAPIKTNGESKLAVCKVVFDLTVAERLDGRIVRAVKKVAQ